MAKKKSTSKKRSTVKKTGRRSERQYFAGRIVQKKGQLDNKEVVTLTERELDRAEARMEKYTPVDMDRDKIPDALITKAERQKMILENRKWSGKKVSVDGRVKQDRSLDPMIKDNKYYTRVATFDRRKDAEEQAKLQRERPEVQEAIVSKVRGGYATFIRFNTAKKAGYVIRGGRVHYRTKTGKEGSMPITHIKMVRRWGLEEVEDL